MMMMMMTNAMFNVQYEGGEAPTLGGATPGKVQTVEKLCCKRTVGHHSKSAERCDVGSVASGEIKSVFSLSAAVDVFRIHFLLVALITSSLVFV